VINDKICVVAKDHNGTGVMYATATNIGGPWQHHQAGNFTTLAPPCIVVFHNVFHVFFKDQTGQAIFHITSLDGV